MLEKSFTTIFGLWARVQFVVRTRAKMNKVENRCKKENKDGN